MAKITIQITWDDKEDDYKDVDPDIIIADFTEGLKSSDEFPIVEKILTWHK